jgi:hypothetical protein
MNIWPDTLRDVYMERREFILRIGIELMKMEKCKSCSFEVDKAHYHLWKLICIRELFIIKGTNHLKSQFASFHQKMTIDIIKLTTVRGDPLFLGKWPFWWITRSIVDWTRWYIFYIIHVHMDHNFNGDLWWTIIINLKHAHILSLIISRRQIKQIASSKCHFRA